MGGESFVQHQSFHKATMGKRRVTTLGTGVDARLIQIQIAQVQLNMSMKQK